jgi:heme-degrading monooxygenase HmoA
MSLERRPAFARIWRGRVPRARADEYERYVRQAGIPPLEKTALAVQLFREDRGRESEFVTISYWADVQDMSAFTGGEPNVVHHLARDEEFLLELPKRVEVLRVVVDTR